MKKGRKLKLLLFFVLVASSFAMNQGVAKANTATVIQIEIEEEPSKVTYAAGEELDLSDMIVRAYYSDGTSGKITDYQVVGYDSSRMGLQPIIIRYEYFSKAFFVTVTPEKPNNVVVSRRMGNSVTLTWDKVEGRSVTYGVYKHNEEKNEYELVDYVSRNSFTAFGASATTATYKITAVSRDRGDNYESGKSEAITVATKPLPVTGLKAKDATAFSISLEWSQVSDATGYIIYRSYESEGEFVRYGKTREEFFIDDKVDPGTTYRYRVSAYTLDEANEGDRSVTVTASTIPSNVRLRYKAGEEKVRLSWNKIKGADYYDIYVKDEENGDFYKNASVRDSQESTYIVEDLKTGNNYSIYIVVRRVQNGKTYEGNKSNIITFELDKVLDTSRQAILFENYEQFQKSAAYTGIEFFRENVDFDKSIIIPGLSTTNVGGFSSRSMCPQGLTFAENYLLMTAYDMAGEENSVVYVMDKENGELLTTIVLESKTHAGGIAYDGTNVWISVGRRVVSVPFELIDEAAKEERKYENVDYHNRIWLGINASYMTYHDDMLWVGSYNELETTNMHSYDINYDEGVKFTKIHTVTMPTRVQGLAFTDDGHLILSRSCQLYVGLRGYMRQLDVYYPDFTGTEADKNRVILGAPVRVISIPTMNEEIAIDGDYLYVNFESGAFANASYKVDRISAFELSSILE